MSGDGDRLSQCKSDIRSVLIAAKDGFTASELTRDYKEFVGSPIPFQELGFRTLHELLQNMPDVCHIQADNNGWRYHAVADESTQNLKKLVSRQKTNKKKKRGGGHGAAQASWSRATNFARNHNNQRAAAQRSAGFLGQPHASAQQNRNDFQKAVNNHQRPNPINWIVLCLSRHPKGINVAALKNEVEQKAKGAFKFANVDELRLYLQSIPAFVFYDHTNDTAVLKTQNPGTNAVQPPPGFCYPKTAPTMIQPLFLNPASNVTAIDTACPFIRPQFSTFAEKLDVSHGELSEADKIIIVDRVVRIVKDHPSGLKIPLIEALYLDRHGRKLPFAALKHSSCADFLSTINGIKIANVNNEEYVMYVEESAQNVGCDNATRSNTTSTDQPSMTLGHNSLQDKDSNRRTNLFGPSIHKHSLQHGLSAPLSGFAETKDKFVPAVFPNYNESFSGVIVTFYSVEDFFIQRTDSKMLLQQLLDSLKTFYGPLGPGDNQDTAISPETVNDLSAELPCAVYWRNGWYRAYILGCQGPPSANLMVSVRLVDIGILDTVSLDQTRRLAVRFLSTPVQALRARLAKVLKPPNNDFLIHKCRCYVDRITSRRQITATPVKDGRNDLRAVGRLAVHVNVNKLPGVNNDLSINDLSSHLICCGLALPDRSSSYGIIAGYAPQFLRTSLPGSPTNVRCNNLFRASEAHKPATTVSHLTDNETVIGSSPEVNGLAGQLKKCIISYEHRLDVDQTK